VKIDHEMKKISFTSQMMRTLMLDLLDLAQMESRSLKINNEYFNLNEIIEQAFMIVSHVSTMKTIALEKKVDSPKESFFKSIFGDDRRYLQILVNFLSNALKFSPKGNKIIVELKLNQIVEIEHHKNALHRRRGSVAGLNSVLLDQRSTHYVNFDMIVQDFGCGMSQENVNKLFLDFSKLEDDSGMNKHGVGLGLSICKNLIEQMGGKVNVDSKINQGTTFKINFKSSCLLQDAAPCFFG
jgi:signal transduction histidine kinase